MRGLLIVCSLVGVACGATPRSEPVAAEPGAGLAGCYRVDEHVGRGRLRNTPSAPTPEALRQGSLFCLDASSLRFRGAASTWHHVTTPWKVEPLFRGAERVGEVWTSEPERDPALACTGDHENICSIDPSACPSGSPLPPNALRFSRVDDEVRVEILEGGGSVSLVPLARSEEERVRRSAGAAPVVKTARGPLPPCTPRAAESSAREELDGPTPRPTPKCEGGAELVAGACLAYCPSEPASASTGVVLLNSIPTSWVLLDGCLLGRTPQIGRVVPSGAHEFTFVHEERGRELRRIEVRAGKQHTVAIRFR